MTAGGQTLVIAEDTSTGERLRLARIAAGLEQAEMAEAVGISVRSYQRTETGSRPASRLEVAEWARVTGQSIGFLLGTSADDDEPGTVTAAPRAVKQ